MNRLSTYSLLGCLLPGLAAAGAVTGKIVIDGVEYGSSSNVVRGNGRRAEERRPLSCFERITVKAGVNVVYRPGKRCEARLTGDSNLLDLIETDVRGDELRISLSRSIQSRNPLRVEVQSPRLSELSIPGAADAELVGVDAAGLRIRLDGSGDVRASGRAGTLEVLVAGSGNLDLDRLQADAVRVHIGGAADVAVNARKSLEVDLSGAGNVVYHGRPDQVITHISGAGNVQPGE